jgi:hypothetical protein
VSVLVVAQSSSEIPERLMNNPVLSADEINDDEMVTPCETRGKCDTCVRLLV